MGGYTVRLRKLCSMRGYTVRNYRCWFIVCTLILSMMAIYWNTTTFHNVAIYVGVERVPEVTRTSRDETRVAMNKHYKICSKDGDICQHGRIRLGRKYSIFTSSLFDGIKSMNYAFDLPLSVRAWHRVGYDCIVLIINDPWTCKKDSKVRVLMETLLDMDGMVLLILNGTQKHSISTSQVSRLLVPYLMQDGGDPVVWNDTYVVAADADIWPLGHGFFDLPPGKEVLHGKMAMHGREIFMPLTYIGMKVKTWIEVMSVNGTLRLPRKSEEVITYLHSMFGKRCCTNIRHGVGPGWGMDQHLASRRVHQWKVMNKKQDRVYVYPRTRLGKFWWTDCYDRDDWKELHNLTGYRDSHVLQYNYKSEVWPRMRPLLSLMYPDNGTLAWCEQYADSFRNQTAVC